MVAASDRGGEMNTKTLRRKPRNLFTFLTEVETKKDTFVRIRAKTSSYIPFRKWVRLPFQDVTQFVGKAAEAASHFDHYQEPGRLG